MPSTYTNADLENLIRKQQQAAAAAQQTAAQPSVKSAAANQAMANSPTVQTTNASVNKAPKYTPSDTVLAARQYLDQQIANKPGAYTSKYSGQLDSILSQIQNREALKYDAAADPLYNIYKDLYIQNGRRAMQDTIGSAAALTGGYGNSYAQSAGQQMYNQYMEGLNAVVPQLQQQAYQRYADEGDRMAQTFQLMNTLENQNYSQYRDTMADWQQERQLAQQAALQSWQLDMQNFQYENDLAYKYYDTDLNEAYRRDSLAEQARQFDAGLAEEIRQADMSDKLQRDKLAEEARQYDSTLAENIRQYDTTTAENIRQYDLSLAEKQRQADLDEAYRQAQLAESIRQYEQNFGEDQRQYDTSLAEKQREFDLAQALDQAQFDLTYQKYLDQLAQLAGTGTGGGNDNKQNNKDIILPREIQGEKAPIKEDTNIWTGLNAMDTAKKNIWEGLNDDTAKESTADYSKLKNGKNKSKKQTAVDAILEEFK